MIRRNHLLSTGVLLLECLPMLPGFCGPLCGCELK